MNKGNCSVYFEETAPQNLRNMTAIYNAIRQKHLDIFSVRWGHTAWESHEDVYYHSTAHLLLNDAPRKLTNRGISLNEEDYVLLEEHDKNKERKGRINNSLPLEEIKRGILGINPVKVPLLDTEDLEKLLKRGMVVHTR